MTSAFKKMIMATSVILMFVMAIGLSGAYFSPKPVAPDPIQKLASIKPGFGPKDHASAMQNAAERLTLANQRIVRDPKQWPYQENFAYVQLAQFRLTGDYSHIVAAQKALDYGMATAPKGSGPALLRAALSVTRHDIDNVARDLEVFNASAVPPAADEKSEALAIAADVDFYAGRYAKALLGYAEANRLSENAGSLFRLGRYYQKMGDLDRAVAKFVRAASAQKGPTRQFLSAVWLSIGAIELERGNWDKAKAHFVKADALFPGHWLTQAHLAQMSALSGDIAAAKRQYEAILTKSQNPEVMDALAALYRSEGNAAQSLAWSNKANAIWATRLAQVPNAAYGHALDHQLVFGTPQAAVKLAQADYQNRPHGDTAIMLANALLAENKPKAALALLEPLAATGWKNGQQYAALSRAYALLNQTEKSEEARDAALAVNARIFEPAASMIWFGHH